MKTTKAITIILVMVVVLVVSGRANATFFSIDSSFSNTIGNTEAFKWSVTSTSITPFILSAGESIIFTYGRFYTDDFGFDNTDLNDNNDSFKANLGISPPNATQSSIGQPDATRFLWLFDEVIIDFVNDPINVEYGAGGHYSLTFLDAFLWGNGYLNLNALLCNKSEAEPVPEPGTMMLLGTGLLGLAVYSKRRSNT